MSRPAAHSEQSFQSQARQINPSRIVRAPFIATQGVFGLDVVCCPQIDSRLYIPAGKFRRQGEGEGEGEGGGGGGQQFVLHRQRPH